MPGGLIIEGVSKAFDGVKAVENCSLTVTAGEIIALLGPSGCGKTTLLNLIAGFEFPDTGSIHLGERDITLLPPHRRRTGMVFQNYALFPHMTVEDNILYGPRVQGAPLTGVVAEVAGLLQITHLLARFPSQLSGGQRQRVALARALAVKPEVLLLDEAFSALDRNLREEMQIELSLLLHRLGITTILVTHDQREAFALSDRIAVMEAGRIGQIGRPEDIYRQPATPFIFSFLGSSNRVAGVVAANGDLQLMEGVVLRGHAVGRAPGTRVTVGLRAEAIGLSRTPTPEHQTRPVTVQLSTFLGQAVRTVIAIDGTTLVCETAVLSGTDRFATGDAAYLAISADAAHILDETGRAA